MAIFGKTEEFILNNITIIAGHDTTPSDHIVNMILGITLVFCWIISTTLNPLVFLYNYNQKRTVAQKLFLILAVSDFLTNIGGCLVVAIELLQEEVLLAAHLPDTLTLLRTLVIKPLSYLTFVVTSLLCITRYIQISWPFYVIRTKALYAYIIIYMMLYMTKHVVVSLFLGSRAWSNYIQEVVVIGGDGVELQLLTIAGIIPQAVHALIAAIVSILTIIKLITIPRMSRNTNSIRYSVAIVGMNAANTTWAVLLFYSLIKSTALIAQGMSLNGRFEEFYQDRFRVFITYGFLIYFLSAFNPLILVLTSSQIKTFLHKLFLLSNKEDLMMLIKCRFKLDPARGLGQSSNGTIIRTPKPILRHSSNCTIIRTPKPILIRTSVTRNLNVVSSSIL